MVTGRVVQLFHSKRVRSCVTAEFMVAAVMCGALVLTQPNRTAGVQASAPIVTDGSLQGQGFGFCPTGTRGSGFWVWVLGFRGLPNSLLGLRVGFGFGVFLGFETSLLFQLNKRLSEEKWKDRKSSGWGHMGPLYRTQATGSYRLAQSPILGHPLPRPTSSFQTLPPVSVTSLNLAHSNRCHTASSPPTDPHSPLLLLSVTLLLVPLPCPCCSVLGP